MGTWGETSCSLCCQIVDQVPVLGGGGWERWVGVAAFLSFPSHEEVWAALGCTKLLKYWIIWSSVTWASHPKGAVSKTVSSPRKCWWFFSVEVSILPIFNLFFKSLSPTHYTVFHAKSWCFLSVSRCLEGKKFTGGWDNRTKLATKER